MRLNSSRFLTKNSQFIVSIRIRLIWRDMIPSGEIWSSSYRKQRDRALWIVLIASRSEISFNVRQFNLFYLVDTFYGSANRDFRNYHSSGTSGQKAANAIFISSNMHICWRSLELQLYFVLIQLNLRFLETKSGSRVDADISTLQTSARDFSFSLYRLCAGRFFIGQNLPFKSFDCSFFVSSQPHNRPLHQHQLQRVRCVPLEKVLYSFFYQVKQRVWPLIYVLFC